MCELKPAAQGLTGSAFGPFGKDGSLVRGITLWEHSEEGNL